MIFVNHMAAWNFKTFNVIALRFGFKQICVKWENLPFPLFFLFFNIFRRV